MDSTFDLVIKQIHAIFKINEEIIQRILETKEKLTEPVVRYKYHIERSEKKKFFEVNEMVEERTCGDIISTWKIMESHNNNPSVITEKYIAKFLEISLCLQQVRKNNFECLIQFNNIIFEKFMTQEVANTSLEQLEDIRNDFEITQFLLGEIEANLLQNALSNKDIYDERVHQINSLLNELDNDPNVIMKEYPIVIFSSGEEILECNKCHTHIGRCIDMHESRKNNFSFRGKYGECILIRNVVNIRKGPVRDVVYLTGNHKSSTIYCIKCDQYLGWYYIYAEDNQQKYKETQCCLEKSFVSFATTGVQQEINLEEIQNEEIIII